MCGEPPDMSNSTLETHGYNVGNFTTYECVAYYKVAGESTRNTTSTCQLNTDLISANWTEPDLCEGMGVTISRGGGGGV